jgi:hypothetical protein
MVAKYSIKIVSKHTNGGDLPKVLTYLPNEGDNFEK